jgi:hypothetical protein
MRIFVFKKMWTYPKKLKERLLAFLAHRRLFKTAAFFQSLPYFIAAIAVGYASYAIEATTTADRATKILKAVLFLLSVVWWMIQFYESHQKLQNKTQL